MSKVLGKVVVVGTVLATAAMAQTVGDTDVLKSVSDGVIKIIDDPSFKWLGGAAGIGGAMYGYLFANWETPKIVGFASAGVAATSLSNLIAAISGAIF